LAVLPQPPRTTSPGSSSGAPPLRRAAVALALSASLLFSAAVSFAEPSAEDKAAARALATQGAEALKATRFAEALDLVTRAEAILHAPTHLLMIARAQTGVGKLVAAQETYLKLLHEDLRADAPAAFKNAQASARDELPAIEPKIASLRIALDGAAQKKATVKLDEETVPAALLNVYRPVDPGPHVIAVYPLGQSPVKGSVDLREGERREIKLTVPDAPAPSSVPAGAVDNPDAARLGPIDASRQQPRDSGTGGFFTPLRGAGIAVGVVGVAGAAVGAFLIAKGFSDQSAANALCPGNVCNIADKAQVTSLDQDAANFKTIGAIVLPVGVAALGAGVALIVVGKPRSGAAVRSVAPWFGGTSGGVRGEF
jgi:hypothetical protein